MRNLKRYAVVMSMSLIGFMITTNISAEEIVKETYEVEMSDSQECMIIDSEDCTMKIVNVEPEGEWGYTWQVYLENKTDVELMFDMTDVSVNGMMCDPYWAVSVEAGTTLEEEIIWDSSELEWYGIDDIGVIEFTLTAYDNEDWEAGNVVYSDYKLYPNGKDAAIYVERESLDTDVVLFETEECSITEIGFEEDGIWGTEWNIYIENNSERDLLISFEDVSVNGSMCDPYWGTVVTAGNNAYAAISWMEEDLEASGIAQIEDVQGTMFVYDNDDWESDALAEEQIFVSMSK